MSIETLNHHNSITEKAAATDFSTASGVDIKTHCVILLNAEQKVCDLLVAENKDKLEFLEMSSSREMLAELINMNKFVDAMVLGVGLKEPVRLAQRVHAMGKDIPLLILTEPEQHETLKQALQFAPFIGNNIIPWSMGSIDRLSQTLSETVKRTQKRRSYSNYVTVAKKRLGEVYRERPQVTHYLDQLLDQAPIGVINVDIKCQVLGLNRCARQILRLTERETLGESLIEIFPLSERDELKQLIAQCVAPSRQRPSKVLDVSKTVGSTRYVEVMASSLVDRSGQLGASVILQDVTARICAEQERSKAEAALRVSESRYRELVQTMSEALALTDEQHRITFVNDSFCNMFGYSSEEVLTKPLLSFVHEDHLEVMKNCILNPEQSDTTQRYETAWMTRNGKKIYTLTSPKRIFDDENGYAGCLGVFTDITERKKIEEREKRHLMEMAHVSRVTTLGEMSSQIAHELSQPLSAISALSTGSLKMLKSNSSNLDEIIESLTDISEQSGRAREVVNRLRNFIRFEEIQYTQIELNKLVHNVVRLVEVEARWHSLPFTLDLHEGPLILEGDRILLEQVLLNLVHNAIEAMEITERKQRRLKISTSTLHEDTLQVEVIDNGPGISKKNIKEVFKTFYTTKPDGIGMGLAIVSSIIVAHKGKISVSNNDTGGATFCFTLPAKKEEVYRGN